MKVLIGIPVYNEEKTLNDFLRSLLTEFFDTGSNNVDFLLVDDGSNDRSLEIYKNFSQMKVLRHSAREGYGKTIIDILRFGASQDYDVAVTIDADLQHSPKTLPLILERIQDTQVDVVSSSRYYSQDCFVDLIDPPLIDRFLINMFITRTLNKITSYNLTDSFCGLKAYRLTRVRDIQLSEEGYSIPLEFWMKAARSRLNMVEVPTPLIYFSARRPRSGWKNRLASYIKTLQRFAWSRDQNQAIKKMFYEASRVLSEVERGNFKFHFSPFNEFEKNLEGFNREFPHESSGMIEKSSPICCGCGGVE